MRDGEGDARLLESDTDVFSESLAERDEATHQCGAEKVAGLDLVGRVDREGIFEFRIFEPDEIGLATSAPFLKHPPEVPESTLGKVGEDKGASLKVFVEVGDEEEPFENRHVGSLRPPLAIRRGLLFLGINFGEAQSGLSVGAVNEILAPIAIGRGGVKFCPEKGFREDAAGSFVVQARVDEGQQPGNHNRLVGGDVAGPE